MTPTDNWIDDNISYAEHQVDKLDWQEATIDQPNDLPSVLPRQIVIGTTRGVQTVGGGPDQIDGASGRFRLSNKSLFVDSSDISKQFQFVLSGITTKTLRTITVPDVSDTLVTLAATQSLSNKTLTAPKMTSYDSIRIGANKVWEVGQPSSSAVNYLGTENAATGLGPDIYAAGTDTNIDLVLIPKGTGAVKTGGQPVMTVKPRETTTTSSATPTPNVDTTDLYTITALAAAATFGAPTGTPSQGQKLTIRMKDNGTARALTWNAIYRAGTDVALPTTTVLSKTLYCGFMYNSTDTKWDLLAVTNNI